LREVGLIQAVWACAVYAIVEARKNEHKRNQHNLPLEKEIIDVNDLQNQRMMLKTIKVV
jgi:hypothetical protein